MSLVARSRGSERLNHSLILGLAWDRLFTKLLPLLSEKKTEVDTQLMLDVER